ncbi:hypothetical protein ACSZNR_07070 [Aeromonas caviae]
MADNRRSGFVLLYKSLKEVPFYRDPVRKALWLHLLLEAAHERCEVSFNGNRLLIQRGQVVGSARSLGEACGISEDSARRSLDAFEQEGMISRSSKQGTRGYTLVTLLNYDPYQRGVSEHIGAEFRAELQPASKQGTEGVSQSDGAELGAEYHAEDLNKINNKTNKDLKDSSSQLADATFDQQGEGTAIEGVADPEPKARVIPEAAIQTPSGKAWGTGDDLMTAQWMFRRVQLITPTAIEPNWAQWANVIRLMRELDQRSHRDICELYDWVSRDAFWCANVLSPQKLRQKWDQLQAKRGNPSGGHQRPLSNLAQAQQQAQALRAAGSIMTTTLPSNVTSLPVNQATLQVSTGMSMFLADELLPLMAGCWPASASQLDANARGVAMAWGVQLRGFTAQQIREAVLELADDAGRQFAPRPAEVKAAILQRNPVPMSAPVGCRVSLRACEMQAEARVFVRDRQVTDEAVQVELLQVQAELRREGVTITGRMG